MKNPILILFVVITSLCLFQCNETDPEPNPTPGIEFDCADEPKACELSGLNGNFAIDLFKC